MRIFPLVLALAVAGMAVPARAEEDDPSQHRLKLILDGTFFINQAGNASFWRAGAAAGASLDLFPALSVRGLVHAGKSSFSYDGNLTDDLKMRTELLSKTDFSIEGGLTLKLLQRGPVTLTAFGEFEATPVRQELELVRSAIRTEKGDFDISTYSKEHAEFFYSWYRLTLGTGCQVRLGRFTPKLLIGFERLEAAVDLHVDGAGKETLTTLGYDAQRIEDRYSLDRNMFLLMPGLEIRLPARFAIDIRGAIAPIGGGLYASANVGLSWRP